MKPSAILAAALAAFLLAGPASASEPVKMVASFSIIGDIAKTIGGDRVAVETLVGPNGDAHVFSPSPADARKVSQARLLLENGLGLEGWMSKLAKSAGSKAERVVVSKGVTPREMAEDESHGGHSHDHGEADPHAWQDVANVKIYAANVRDALVAADPEGRDVYVANAQAYEAKLDALDREIRDAWAKVPAERRRIITSHDAFGYYSTAYGLKIVAPQGASTETEASAKDVARIIRQIRAEKIPAVFVETITDRRLVERIAKETGAKVGGALYSDALSPADGPAGTYIDMMRWNLGQLTDALSG